MIHTEIVAEAPGISHDGQQSATYSNCRHRYTESTVGGIRCDLKLDIYRKL